MTQRFVVRGAEVLDESGGFDGPTDVLVVDGRVTAVGTNVAAAEDASLA